MDEITFCMDNPPKTLRGGGPAVQAVLHVNSKNGTAVTSRTATAANRIKQAHTCLRRMNLKAAKFPTSSKPWWQYKTAPLNCGAVDGG